MSASTLPTNRHAAPCSGSTRSLRLTKRRSVLPHSTPLLGPLSARSGAIRIAGRHSSERSRTEGESGRGERLRPHGAEDLGILGSVSASVRAGGGAPAPVQERLRLHGAEDMGILGSVSASVRAGGGAPAPVQESW